MRGMRFWIWAAAIALVTAQQDGSLTLTLDPNADQVGLGLGKREGDSRADKIGIESEGPASTYEVEQAAIRAYPGDSIPTEATLNAQLAFRSAGRRSASGRRSARSTKRSIRAFSTCFS